MKQGTTESVSYYILRFRTATNRFEFSVECQTPGRAPWAALSVTLFQHGLIPSIQCLQLSDKPVTSLREAVDRERHHEAASLAGGTASAMSFTPVPNRAVVSQFAYNAANTQRGPRPPSTPGGGGGSKPRGNNSGGGSRGGAGGARADRPKCGFPGCRQPMGHTTANCYQRLLEEKERTNAGKSARFEKGKGKKRDDSDDDDGP